MSGDEPDHSSQSESVVLSELWKTAYRKYRRFWVNMARTAQLSDEEAEDIVHTVIAGILKNHLREFESLEHLRNYVTKSVLNRAIQQRKRAEKKLPWGESVEVEFSLHSEPTDADIPRMDQAFREGLLRLSRAEFEVIKLRFFCRLRFIDMSALLGIPISTLKSREDVAVRKLRAWVRKKGF